ncbi:MAG: DMT family transporter, partial [Kangiellaceae bacterium]|nr:DMT family transporter [Kangiellaceae bacterium]
LFSALVWAAYALVQKRLFTFYSSNQINLLLYSIGALILLPFSELSSLVDVNQVQLLALLFCCFNTLFAYGAFAEALKVWQASRVSAVLAITPLITLVANKLASIYWPQRFMVPELSLTALGGAGLVIAGSVACALARSKSAEPKKALT